MAFVDQGSFRFAQTLWADAAFTVPGQDLAYVADETEILAYSAGRGHRRQRGVLHLDGLRRSRLWTLQARWYDGAVVRRL